MKNKSIPTLFLISSLWMMYADSLHSQDTIPLKNPSFEGVPHRGASRSPNVTMWNDCGLSQFPAESPPDIHPVIENAWGVNMLAQDGETYLGLVVRANASWESVSQRLFIPLRAGVCYSLTAMLAMSDIYKSATAMTQKLGTNELESFANPVMLVIWGGREECDKLEILAESSDVANHEWKPYTLILSPHSNYTHITIEAYYSKTKEELYNGNIMIDNLSPIVEVECKQ